jgi:hypothetical protein
MTVFVTRKTSVQDLMMLLLELLAMMVMLAQQVMFTMPTVGVLEPSKTAMAMESAMRMMRAQEVMML